MRGECISLQTERTDPKFSSYVNLAVYIKVDVKIKVNEGDTLYSIYIFFITYQ